jgi:hypothetical protein
MYKVQNKKISNTTLSLNISEEESWDLCFFWKLELNSRSRGSSVSIMSDYGLDDWGSILTEAEDFSSSLCIQTGSGAHPASCRMGTGGPFPGGRAWPGRDADHSPPSSAEVKYE